MTTGQRYTCIGMGSGVTEMRSRGRVHGDESHGEGWDGVEGGEGAIGSWIVRWERGGRVRLRWRFEGIVRL